ncbi:FMN-binding protein [Crenothrix sp.]|uniref:FMN-binding protein n=1 Tax=Crenothrix sp. TaxID=3100433 RepID=UPI00374CA7BB
MQTLRLLFFFTLLTATMPVLSGIFYSKNEAMELAFGKDAQVEVQSLFPDEQQTASIEQQAKVKLGSGMLTFYVGKQQDKILGYAAIESITVRTKPETLLIVLTPEGELRNVTTLAFHEPPEYQPPERWFEQLYKKPLADMEFNKGIDGISGATLSARADLDSVRKIMAIYQVMIKNQATH